jgi:hypothetical protein
VALVVPTSKERDAAAPDIAGLVLSSATMALLVFTIIEAPAYGWGAVRSLAGFAVSAVLLAAFIVRERRAADPMLDVRLFRNLRFSAASAAVTVSFFNNEEGQHDAPQERHRFGHNHRRRHHR